MGDALLDGGGPVEISAGDGRRAKRAGTRLHTCRDALAVTREKTPQAKAPNAKLGCEERISEFSVSAFWYIWSLPSPVPSSIRRRLGSEKLTISPMSDFLALRR